MATVTSSIPESRAVDTETRLLIGNEWIPSESGRTFPTINPATGEEIAQISEADAADVDKAVLGEQHILRSCRRGLDAGYRQGTRNRKQRPRRYSVGQLF
jgi:hypothetical protein